MNALILTALLIGQCPGGVCPVPQPTPTSTYQWREVPGRPDVQALTLDGVQIGAFDGVKYTPFYNGSWGTPTTPPIQPPTPFAKRTETGALPSWQTTGVDWSQCGKGAGNSFKGTPIDRVSAFEKIQSGDGVIPDRSTKPMVSFVDNDYAKANARRNEFLSHHLSSHFNVQAYAKDDPIFKAAVDPAKVKTLPTVYFQVSPTNGKVLERIDGDVPMDRVVEAAKRHDVNYDPSKDPTGKVDLYSLIKPYLTREVIVGAIVAFLAFLGIRKNTPPAQPQPAKV